MVLRQGLAQHFLSIALEHERKRNALFDRVNIYRKLVQRLLKTSTQKFLYQDSLMPFFIVFSSTLSIYPTFASCVLSGYPTII
jgi:hypothetical protein